MSWIIIETNGGANYAEIIKDAAENNREYSTKEEALEDCNNYLEKGIAVEIPD